MPARDAKVELMGKVPLFSLCDDKELRRIAALADGLEVKAGEVLTEEGKPGKEFFVIQDGTATVTIKGKKLATLGPGEFFGEMALLDQGPRAATVTADSPMRLYILVGSAFASLLDQSPSVGRKMMAALAYRLRELEKAPSH